jgi:K+-transporting ATPase ATPase A chain
MSGAAWVQFFILIALLALTAPPLGAYIARIYGDDQSTPFGDRVFRPIEGAIYRICRIDPAQEQRWTGYATSLIAFSLVSFLAVYVVQRVQGHLPLDPTGVRGVVPHLSFNTAVSFMTNTNWQSYAGETTLSHFTQMIALTVQNFLSAAAGMCVMAALIRGLARKQASTLGNFWTDLVRSTVRVLIPISFVLALIFLSQGVIQNLHGPTVVHTVSGGVQKIPGGPVASQEAIKMIGTNGGGFFNANSAHPFENPTRLTDLIGMWSILVLPFALAFAFGRMVKDERQGYAVVAIMFTIWFVLAVPAMLFEAHGNPELTKLGVDQTAAGNMEGKEVRVGAPASALWGISTTGTSNGSVDSMHDSFTPLAGGELMLHMKLGEVSPGGVGVGLNGLLILAILSVFIAGLMVGRTPEYLGKKIQAAEMKMVVLYVLAMPVTVLVFTATAVSLKTALASLHNIGPHGLSEILYAYTSAANNNGSAFAGLNAATPWFDTTLGLAMLVGRFFLIVPTLGIAGSLARKPALPPGAGTFPTHTPMFVVLVIGVTAIVAALTFFPALALGPIVEHLTLIR